MDESVFYRSMYRIRRFEETVLEEFMRGVFAGTTHTSLGQEANAVGVISALSPDDIIVTNHRCHGHFIAYGGDLRALFAEMMGRQTGICGGRGGSQHIHWRNLFSNGVQGGIVPIAAGMALAEKAKKTGAVVTVFIGDGTFGEGVIYEAFNMASLWKVPLFIVVENNHIAQTTPTALVMAGDINGRLRAFNIPVTELDSCDVSEINHVAAGLISKVRKDERPYALVLNSARFGPHSKGDDTRSEEELQALRSSRDPLRVSESRLDQDNLKQVKGQVESEVRAAFAQALADPPAQLEVNE
ncbi:MAG TPA: thiamine pyrophosphate-dependent dehydrogenase E1 component subunit alpha [Anaerolineaceae bacterium]|nr:thiamine pyrophosphate-dependent dehydrogenase E1 component subunit alpha [Anaerolineaceae bacterium]